MYTFVKSFAYASARRQVLNPASRIPYSSAFVCQKFGFQSLSALKQQKKQAEETAYSAKDSTGKLRSALAIGGVTAAILGVAACLTLANPSVEDSPNPSKTTEMLLHSAAQVYDKNTQRLTGLSMPEHFADITELEWLSNAEVSSLLCANEKVWEPKNGIAAMHTNQISSNVPIEDYISLQELDGSSDGTKYMVSVFDGHSGYRCAEQLSMHMGPMINLALEAISQNKTIDNKTLSAALEQFKGVSKKNQVPAALSAAFIAMDKELVETALEKYKKLNDLSQIDSLLGPASSGSCGLVAVVDNDANEIVVANTGDSRAVIGKRLANGTWKAVRLNEDHNAHNKDELARLAIDHPDEQVIIRNRMLGNLAVTRAFGNARYKWPIETQQEMFPTMFKHGHRRATTPDGFKTPPYITAQPTLVTHKLDSTDKFMIVASDGLYEQLSDSEVVNIVGKWYDSQNIPSAKKDLDGNVATHVIRNALATDEFGCHSNEHLVRIMSVPSPFSRYYRDDISAIVLTLNGSNK